MKKIIFAFMLFISFQSLACPVSAPLLFEKLHSKQKSLSLPTEIDFQNLIQRVRRVYDPEFQKRGYETEYMTLWHVDEPNAMTASSEELKKVWFVFPGALLRAKFMTHDSFLFIACHEIGHHLGGFPKDKVNPWSSVEGQADYFATLQCMKRILQDDPENKNAGKFTLPEVVTQRCEEAYSTDEERNICLRSTKAALDAYRFLNFKFTGIDINESFLNEILPEVSQTNMTYPEILCRAETAFAGAICNRTGIISEIDEKIGVCHESKGDIFGMRPRCWFAPQN